MSKFVKDQITKDIQRRIGDIRDCLLVNVVGLDAIATTNLRKDLRAKGIHVLVVKNNLARRACEGGPLNAEKIKAISKWPNRQEQLSILSGQILSPGANLSGALLGPGGLLASQLKEKGEEEEGGAAAEEAPAASA